MSTKFSVIVPIFKVEQFLTKCIESILGQTYSNFELLLVDDGSPDNCPVICDKYAKKDSRIKVIHKQNGGLVSARKEGASNCNGDYVLNVDGDDWIEATLLDKVNSVILKHNPDVIVYGANYWHSKLKNEIHLTNATTGYYDKQKIVQEIYPYLIENSRGDYFSPSIWSKVVRREIYCASQLAVDDLIKIGEDTAVTKPIISMINSMFIIDEPLYYYRQNMESMTKEKKPFDIMGPKLLGKHLDNTVGGQIYFKEQIARYVVHQLFIVCMSQYSSNSSKNAKKYIKHALDDEYYTKKISECRYSIDNYKGQIAKFCLKHKMLIGIEMMSKIWIKK